MSDIHIDIDDADDSAATSKQAKSRAKQTDEIEIEFEEVEGRQDRYRFWGWQRLPEMLSDFVNRPNQTLNDFLGRDKPFGRIGVNEVEMRQRLDEAIPEDARQYFRTAQRQFLLGWRSLINGQLQKLEAQEEIYRARKENPVEADISNGDIPPADIKPAKIEVEDSDVL